jgi:hypothetical protein
LCYQQPGSMLRWDAGRSLSNEFREIQFFATLALYAGQG